MSFLELVSCVSPYVMCSVIASFFAAAIAGKAQQQHGGVSPASEQARQTRQTDRPGERAKPSSIAHHPVGSTPFKSKMEKKNLPWLLLFVCFLVFCLSMFFLGGVLETFFGAFFSQIFCACFVALWLKSSPTLRTILEGRFELCWRENHSSLGLGLRLGPVCQLVR